MARRPLAVRAAPLVAAFLGACTGDVFTSAEGPLDASTDDGSSADASSDGAAEAATDAAPDAPVRPDAGKGDAGACDASQPCGPTGIRVVRTIKVEADAATVNASLTVAPGDLLVVAAFSSSSADMQVADSLVNAWKPTTAHLDSACGSVVQGQIWYAEKVAGGNDVVTLAEPSSTAAITQGFFLLDVAGAATSGALDGQAGQGAPAVSNAMTTGPVGVAGAGEMVIALFADTHSSGPMTAGPGFTAEGSAAFTALAEAKVTAAAGQVDAAAALPSGLSDLCWVATAASFKAP